MYVSTGFAVKNNQGQVVDFSLDYNDATTKLENFGVKNYTLDKVYQDLDTSEIRYERVV